MKYIVPNDNCLTQDQMLRYLRDETSAQDTRAIDRHLAQCPLCTDALEGAMQLPTEQLTQAFSNIDTKISKRIETLTTIETMPLKVVSRNPTRYWFMAAAASVALLIVSGIWYFNFKENKSAALLVEKSTHNAVENTVTTPPPDYLGTGQYKAEDSLKNDGEIVAEASQTPKTVAKTTTKPIILTKPNAPSQPIADVSREMRSETNYTTAAPKPIEKAKAEEDIVELKQKVLEKRALLKDIPQSSEPAFDMSNNPENKKGDTNSAQKPVLAYAPPQDYAGAAAQNRVLQKEVNAATAPQGVTTNAMKKKQMPAAPQVATNLFQSGLNFYKIRKFDLAIGDFNRLIAVEKSGENYENALWYLANAYWLKGDKKTAKTLFKRIIAEKNPQVREAEEFLTE